MSYMEISYNRSLIKTPTLSTSQKINQFYIVLLLNTVAKRIQRFIHLLIH